MLRAFIKQYNYFKALYFAAHWLDVKGVWVWRYNTLALLPLFLTVSQSFSTPCHPTLSTLQWGMNLSSCTRVDRSGWCHLSLSIPPLSLFLLFTSLPLRFLSSRGGSGRHRKSAFLMRPLLVLLFLIESTVFLRGIHPL